MSDLTLCSLLWSLDAVGTFNLFAGLSAHCLEGTLRIYDTNICIIPSRLKRSAQRWPMFSTRSPKACLEMEASMNRNFFVSNSEGSSSDRQIRQSPQHH